MSLLVSALAQLHDARLQHGHLLCAAGGRSHRLPIVQPVRLPRRRRRCYRPNAKRHGDELHRHHTRRRRHHTEREELSSNYYGRQHWHMHHQLVHRAHRRRRSARV